MYRFYRLYNICFFRGSQEEEGSPRITFKKFNRFSRPDIRQSLLQKILGKGKGKNTLDPEEQERVKEEQKDEFTKEEETLEPVDNNNIDPVNTLMTTLDASTIFPENREKTSTFLEVATIRYSVVTLVMTVLKGTPRSHI